jgi:murein DD-endopeptidase MepM/ murein hydrolase activator NlpD
MRVQRVWLFLVLVLGLWSSGGIAGAVDPRVERARADLRDARAVQDQTAVDLDHVAAAYEQARAHAERLAAEADDNGRAMAEARVVAAEADGVLRQRLAMLFKHPGMAAQALSPGTLSDSIGETLHRVELIEQLTQLSARDRGRAERALGRVRNAEHDYQVVTAGVSNAVRDRRQRAADLSVALGRAQRQVATAREDVRAAEAVVAAERELRRREREQARLLALATASDSGAPLPPVDGKTCPIGAPNGFSDTWGASRSGGRTHQGVDMFAAYGMALYAVDDGTVRISNNTLGGLSIHLTTETDRYYYAHLSKSLVVTGQRVRRGQHIGATGNSGNARYTPPHLHWEYHPGGGAAVNPYPLALALCRS